jgi:hypothetical protein
MGRLAAFDSEAVDVVFMGIPIRDGRAADAFLTVEPDEEAFKSEKGADGLVVRYATHNRLYNVKIKLKASSSENIKLKLLHAADTQSTNGAAVSPFLFKDNNGSTLMAGGQSWITKAPPWQIGQSNGDVEWQGQCVADVVQMIFGGN